MVIDRGDLVAFSKVRATKSFSKAAQTMFCTQSAVSRRILRLESELGCLLFERSTRGLRPTAAADRLAELAEGIETLFAQAERLAQRESLCRIGTTTSIADCLLPGLIVHLRRAGIHVHIIAGHSADIVTALLENRVDVGIVLRPPKTLRLRWYPWHISPLVAAATRDSATILRQGWDTIRETPVVLYVFGPDFPSFRERIRAAGGRIVIDNASPASLALKLIRHEGITFVPLAAIPTGPYVWARWPELSAYGWDIGLIARDNTDPTFTNLILDYITKQGAPSAQSHDV